MAELDHRLPHEHARRAHPGESCAGGGLCVFFWTVRESAWILPVTNLKPLELALALGGGSNCALKRKSQKLKFTGESVSSFDSDTNIRGSGSTNRKDSSPLIEQLPRAGEAPLF